MSADVINLRERRASIRHAHRSRPSADTGQRRHDLLRTQAELIAAGRDLEAAQRRVANRLRWVADELAGCDSN